MKEDGCTKVQLTNDKEVYGAGLAKNIERAAEAQGLEIISNDAIDKNAANYRSLAQKAKGAGADCFVYSGITANNAVQLYKDFSAALPDAKLYGPDGVAESGFADPKEGGIPADVAAKIKVHGRDPVAGRVPAGGPGVLHAVHREVRRGRTRTRTPSTATRRCGSRWTRSSAPARAARRTSSRRCSRRRIATSVLGTYSIDENGDTTLTDYGVYTIEGGELTFDSDDQGAGRLIEA